MTPAYRSWTVASIKRRWLRRTVLVLVALPITVGAVVVYGVILPVIDVVRDAIGQAVSVWRKP